MSLLLATLARTVEPGALNSRNWNQLLVEARQAAMVARLGWTLDTMVARAELPEVVQDVLEGAESYVEYIQTRVRHELNLLAAVAIDCPYRVLLMKGAAYIAQGCDAAMGRGLSDLDVLVPQDYLVDFEARLNASGWRFSEQMTGYDEYYYRELSHELPPMRHPKFQFELDVHHNILQPTHRLAVDASRLLDRAISIPDTPYHAFCLEDQILHSAAHLTMSDELRGGLRDIHDITLLCKQGHRQDISFFEALVDRSFALGLQRSLYYVLAFAITNLGLEVPAHSWGQLRTAAPPAPVDRLMTTLIDHRLRPASTHSSKSDWAEQLLYLRSHWIRMPPGLLASHLLRKSLQRGKDSRI